MNQIKAQDVIRHIFKDEDKGFAYIEGLPLSDSIEVLTKVLPELQKAAEEKKNANDIGYFGSIETIYKKIVIEKLKKAEHLWVVYSSTTSYPYMIDDDMIVLYDYANSSKVIEKLQKNGYKVELGIETPGTFFAEIGHMYRNGYKNLRFTDGKDNMLSIPREEFVAYDEFFDDKYVTNPSLMNALIAYCQEVRKTGDKSGMAGLIESYRVLLNRAMVNADYMVPCEKDESEEEITISHPYLDITDSVPHKEGETVAAIPAFTDGFEMDKCYAGKNENMLYKYEELISSVEELGVSGVVINPLGMSFYLPLPDLKQILS